MANFYKTLVTLNKYKSFECDSVEDSEFVFEISNDVFDRTARAGSFELHFYQDGIQKDLSLNGWTFAGICRGSWVDATHQKHVDLFLESSDPSGNYITQIIRSGNLMESNPVLGFYAAAMFMNAAMFASFFSNSKEFESAQWLYRGNFYNLEFGNIGAHSIDKIKLLENAIKRNVNNNGIPAHFIPFAKNEYFRIVHFLINHVSKEDLLKKIFFDLQ